MSQKCLKSTVLFTFFKHIAHLTTNSNLCLLFLAVEFIYISIANFLTMQKIIFYLNSIFLWKMLI
jgi:hypothetical protein